MRMICNSFLFFILLAFHVMTGQEKISGIIKDAESGEFLTGANVVIEHTNQGTTTNEKGFFNLIDIQDGPVIVVASYVGYESRSRTITPGKDLICNFDLYKKEIYADQVVVTASRNEQMIGDVAGRIGLISSRMIAATPNNSVDDLFKSTSGVFVDRSSGFITHSAVVNIRNITAGEQGRVLALLDGLPMNKTDGGTVNWNRINSDDVDRIEIFKGPGSSVYGNNAMGGVVNIITKRSDKEGVHGYAEASYGSMNTLGQKLGFNGRLSGNHGLVFRLSGFRRTSEGYNTYRENFRDLFSVNSNLRELGVDAKIGYDLNDKTNFQFTYNFYDDTRGQGTKVKENNSMSFKTNFASCNLIMTLSSFKVNLNAFYQLENYLRVMEKYKTSTSGALTSYDLIYVDADRLDYGTNLNVTLPLSGNTVTTGIEVKRGKIDGADVYQTSTDVVANRGTMLFLSGFLQDEVNLTPVIKIFAGLRFDDIRFSDGEFIVSGATAATNYMTSFNGPLSDFDWSSFTPKISAQYVFSDYLKVYAAYSQGFRAASLDDLTRDGLIKLGFKKANPNLKPESLENIELGLNYDFRKTFYILPSVYVMTGKDFMAYINTGSTVSISGRNRPIIIKDNITKVRFVGGDVDIKYFPSAALSVTGNVAYSKTEILNFIGSSLLEGKELTYSPNTLANIGITYFNDVVNTTLNVHYQSKQFTADDNSEVDASGNSQLIDAATTVDIKLWKKFFALLSVNMEIQNISDVRTIATYDRYSLGRMITAGISVEF